MRLQPVLASLSADGFVRIDNVRSDDIFPLAHSLGVIIPDPRTGQEIRALHPTPAALANPNTLSSRYGVGAFPFHTEAAYLSSPPSLLLLYCRNPGRGDRPTLLIDATDLVRNLSARGQPGIWIVKSGRRPFVAHVAEGNTIRYDAECMVPSGRNALFERDAMTSFLASATPISIDWRQGAVLILNNRRMLHGRGPGTVEDCDRHLERMILRASDGLEL